MASNNKLPLQFDSVVNAPFGAVGISIQGMQVAIELISSKQQAKSSGHKTAKIAVDQIEAYFQDANSYFNLPVVLKGTPFQRNVWHVISGIPKGKTLTYSEIAEEVGSGPRAVANACGANYLPLVIPCHRVVAKKGLGGFMKGDPQGLKIKKWLLKHEGVKV